MTQGCFRPRLPLGVATLALFAGAAAADDLGPGGAAGIPARRINAWLACGTFPGDGEASFRTDSIGEADAAPAPGGAAGGKPWLALDDRLWCRNQDDYVDLFAFYTALRPSSPGEPTENRLAYVHTYVWSPAEREIRIRMGANDAYAIRLNGRPVGESFSVMRTAERDADAVPATLNGGWNRLLLKIGNGRGRWGFYCALTDPAGRPLDGLEYCPDPPGGPLAVVTSRLPAGMAGWPYVELTVSGRPAAPRVPSASPFRLTARGGTPPYRWSLPEGSFLPPHLRLDAAEGEIRGACGPLAGAYAVTVEVRDAAGASARATLPFEVTDRPTRWMEEGKIGGLVHGSPTGPGPWGDPDAQSRSMAGEGYAWAAPTTSWRIPGPDALRIDGDAVEMTRLVEAGGVDTALRGRGVRWGAYIGLPDPCREAFGGSDADAALWPRFLDFLHASLARLARDRRPAVLYLDGARGPYAGKHDWDFDSLYSIVRTLLPECVIIANANDDDIAGDCDVFSFEGDNDRRPYWARWPSGPSGRNPKRLPCETWRYPFPWSDWKGVREKPPELRDDPDYLDASEWCRVVVSLIAEGYLVNLDHSADPARLALHEAIGAWLSPRVASLRGTSPGPFRDEAWGYSVQRGGTVYLHILANPRGKRGWNTKTPLTVGPVAGRIRRARLVPGGAAIPFREGERTVTLDLSGVMADPVDTIVELETEESGGGVR